MMHFGSLYSRTLYPSC